MYCSQRVTKTSNVFFSKNILLYNIIIYFYIIIILERFIFCAARLIVSMNILVRRVTRTSNPYFLNWPAGYLTFQSTDSLEIWRRSSPSVPLSHEPRISKSDVWSLWKKIREMVDSFKPDCQNIPLNSVSTID